MYKKELPDKVASLLCLSAIRKNAILKLGLSINNIPYGIPLNNSFLSFPSGVEILIPMLCYVLFKTDTLNYKAIIDS
ncbi:hypothetical protein SAMN04488033_12233 [Salegentibacter agarivorans]|uniref:Uncharacterized protein n=1 Tax=Salegentibacter agarivorans TaxID=345907 RepID=A0A1I2NQX8_9FLAO|nr:hypothetical protein [Salegentibacter agarivorans]SFG03701.1 hypothetical protein SAMN04488033_12233 [Salegentibacter agarivorans]